MTGDYPVNWTEIATSVKDRAGWRCERCFHPHETSSNRIECDDLCTHPNNGKQRMLTVHHLDMNKTNCVWWNLVALCQGCHLSIQARVDFEQSWMFDLPEWLDSRWVAFKLEKITGIADGVL
jgi:hypothetical protein